MGDGEDFLLCTGQFTSVSLRTSKTATGERARWAPTLESAFH